MNVNLAAGDASFNLDDGRNGRFEGGHVLINSNTPPADTANILGNGGNYFRTYPGQSFNIPFTLTAGGNTASGQIWQMDNSSPENTLFGVSASLPPNAFNGGTLAIAGQSFAVLQNSANTVALSSSGAMLSFSAEDDDDNSLLPHQPDTSDVQRAFAQAYVLALIGDLPNPRSFMPFQLNLSSTVGARDSLPWDTEKLNKNSFWVAYVISAFQYSTASDGDPDTELLNEPLALLGLTFSANGATVIFLATHAEPQLMLNSSDEQDTVNHELSHLFGTTSHATGEPTDGHGTFSPLTLNYIRSTIKPKSK